MKILTRNLTVLAILLAFVQTSKAQYTLAVKEDRVKYDSAVVVEISKYREESSLLNLYKPTTDSLRSEVFSLYEELEKQSSATRSALEEVTHSSERLRHKDDFIEIQSNTIREMLEESKKKKPFYKKPETMLAVGVLVGVLIN